MIAPDTLINGDCLEVMKNIPDKSIDMILCDLPYGCTQNSWDSIIPFDLLWEEYHRVMKPNTAVVLFGDGIFSHKLAMSNPKEFRYNLVYAKRVPTGFLNANRMPLRKHEDILVFYKHLPTYNPQMTKGTVISRKATNDSRLSPNYGKFNPRYNYCSHGKRYPTSIISDQCDLIKNKITHATQKPVAICEYLIKTYSNEGDVVLDNCCGSGTTAVACINTNRKYVCIEKDTEFYNTAKKKGRIGFKRQGTKGFK